MFVVAQTFEEVQVYANRLLTTNSTLFGFDVETTIGRRDNPTAASIIQISTDKQCYLFQIYRVYKDYGTLPSSIIKLLQTPNIVKVGVDLTNDIEALEFYGIKPRGMLDIQLIARTMNIADLSLEGLGQRFIPGFEGKVQLNRHWNWDGPLSNEQIQYAGKDAMYALQIYSGLLNGINISTTIEVDPAKDQEDYLKWVKTNLPMKYDSLINKTANSYGPWAKKYTKIGRENRARVFLESFLEKGLINLDSLGYIFSN
jgi:ribonuclease D